MKQFSFFFADEVFQQLLLHAMQLYQHTLRPVRGRPSCHNYPWPCLTMSRGALPALNGLYDAPLHCMKKKLLKNFVCKKK